MIPRGYAKVFYCGTNLFYILTISFGSFLLLRKIYIIICFGYGQSEVTRRMEEMTISKGNRHNSEGTGVLPRAEIVHDEHPLSLGKTSVWNQFFQVMFTKS